MPPRGRQNHAVSLSPLRLGFGDGGAVGGRAVGEHVVCFQAAIGWIRHAPSPVQGQSLTSRLCVYLSRP